MTETEWLRSTDPTAMFGFLCDSRGESRRKTGRRRLRLFACACVRDVWDLLRHPGSRQALYYGERYADGLATEQELEQARHQATVARNREDPVYPPNRHYWQAAEAATHTAVKKFDGGNHPSVRHAAFSAIAARAMYDIHTGAGTDYQRCFSKRAAAYADLLRDIYANPFREVAFDPRWRTTAAVGVAEQIYDSRGYGNLPVLADALQDAGCEIPAILSHCRDPGRAHVRGCWVVDLVLGKA